MQCVDLGGRRIIKKNFFKQKTAYEISECLVGSEMCIRDRDSFHALLDAMTQKGFTKEELEAAGLIVRSDRGTYLSLIHI